MILDITIVIFIVFFGYLIAKNSRLTHGNVFSNYLILLWFFHLLITLVFFFFISKDQGSDSMRFWRTASNISGTQAWDYFLTGRSTQVMFAICYPLTSIGLSFFTGTVLFSFFGFIAIKIFFALAKIHIPFNSKFFGIGLFPWLFFLPNLHFWSAGVSKDTLVLLAIALFTYGVSDLRKKWVYTLPALLLCTLIRPHITLMLVVGLASVILFGSNMKIYYKIFLAALLLGVAAFIIPQVLEIAGMEEASVDQYSEFSQNKAEKLGEAHTSSAIDISSYPFPLKVFSFLYRPTFIDINGAPALVAAFENLLLLILTVIVLLRKPISSYTKAPLLAKFLLMFLFVGTLLFSLTLGNLGIMLRMRNMFLPGLIFYLLWGMSYLQKEQHQPIKAK